MIAPIDGSAAAKRLFFDRGQDSDLQWSPDGSALAFVVDAHGPQLHRNLPQRCDADCVSRADHVARFHAALVTRRHARRLLSDCTATAARRRIRSTGTRCRGRSGWPPRAPAARDRFGRAGTRRAIRCRRAAGGPFLEWVAGDRLVFNSEQDNWPHLYAVSANGGTRAATDAGPIHGRGRVHRTEPQSHCVCRKHGIVAGRRRPSSSSSFWMCRRPRHPRGLPHSPLQLTAARAARPIRSRLAERARGIQSRNRATAAARNIA